MPSIASGRKTVKVEIAADGATLPAIEFTVEMPEDVEIDDIKTTSGAFFNKDNGIYAWAGAEAPEDGTVMFSASFTVEDTDDTSDDETDCTDDKTDTTQDNDTSDTDNDVSSDTDEDEDVNPETGITVSVAAVAVAGAAFFAAFKSKKMQK